MNERDPLLERLAALPSPEPSAALTASLRAAAHERLRPRPVHRAWTFALVASALTYLGWALRFAAGLY